MDETTEKKLQEENEEKVRNRKKRVTKSFTVAVPAFITRIGEDVKWYYDVRLWSPLIILLLILALCTGRTKAAPEPVVEATEPAAVIEVTEAPTEPEPIDPEAQALAILADSVGAGCSKNVKTIIMWVAINRSEDQANGYGKTLLEEIARPQQWQFYDENAAYSEETYAIAKSVLEIQKNGDLRPLDNDMLWLVLNNDGSVTVRNQFTASANQKWREKTIK